MICRIINKMTGKATNKKSLDRLAKRIKIMEGLEVACIAGAGLGAISYFAGDFIDQDKLSAISLVATFFSTLFGIAAGYRVDELKDIGEYHRTHQINNNYINKIK